MLLAVFGLGTQELLLALVALALWLWMLVDCLRNRSLRGNAKIAWVLIIVMLNVLGALLYFFLKKSR